MDNLMPQRPFLLRMPTGMNGKKLKPVMTYYYERPDGEVIAASNKEASLIHKKYKFLGRTDQSTFFQKIKEAVEEQTEALRELEELEGTISTKEWDKKRRAVADKAQQALRDAMKADAADAEKDKTPPTPENFSMTISPDARGDVDTFKKIIMGR